MAILFSRWYVVSIPWDLPPEPQQGGWAHSSRELQLTGGRVYLARYPDDYWDFPGTWHVRVWRRDRPLSWIVFANPNAQRGTCYVLGLWPAATVVIPAALLWYADRRTRSGPGRCGGCGYDRAGLAADGPCPECGALPTK